MSDLSRLHILLLDDNAHMIQIVRTLLHGFGVRNIRDTRDAAEALDTIRHEAVDIVFTDYEMNLLDGIEFTRMVRTAKDSRNRYVPIILLTAYTERSRIFEARDAGVTEICAKPVTAHQLWLKMSAVINHPRPFVTTKTYFGPDRRRRRKSNYRGPERRQGEAGTPCDDRAYSSRDSAGL